MSATGYLCDNLPDGPERDEALGLIRIGLKFSVQQCGRRPDQITTYIFDLVSKLHKPTFASLLQSLEVASQRHDYGANEVAVVSVNRVFEVVQFHHPRRGTVEISFPALRNKLTKARQFIGKPKR